MEREGFFDQWKAVAFAIADDILARMNPAPSVTVARAATAKTLHAFGDQLTLLTSGAETGGKYAAALAVTPPGGGPPPHYHENEDELFYVIEGRVSFFNHGEWHETGPGDYVFAPRNSVHTFKNVGDTPSRMLIHVSPAGFENFFAKCADEFAKGGAPDMEKLVAIAAEHGIYFVS